MKQHDLKIEYSIRITAGNEVIADYAGDPVIPDMVPPDGLSAAYSSFEAVFSAIIVRPASMAVCRLIDAKLKQQRPALPQPEPAIVPPPGGWDEPLPPVAETLAKCA